MCKLKIIVGLTIASLDGNQQLENGYNIII